MRILPEIKDTKNVACYAYKKKVEKCAICEHIAETNIIVGDSEMMPICLKCAETFNGRL